MRHWRNVTSGSISLVILIVVGVAAYLSDGLPASESQLNDGGAWLLNRSESSVGHVNRVVGEVSSVAGPFSGQFEVDQSDGIVVVNNRGLGQAVLVDTNLSQAGAPVAVLPSVEVYSAPSAAVLVDRSEGSAWRFPREDFSALQSLEGEAPHLVAPPGSVAAVGRGGTVALASELDQSVHVLDLDGSVRVIKTDQWKGQPALDLTLVGTTPIVLVDGALLIGDAGSLEVHEIPFSGGVLQQSSMDGDSVVVISPSGSVVSVDLESGETRTLESLEGTSPLAPIVHSGCVWAVTLEPSPVFHYCARSQPVTGTEIALTLVNNWVWVNDVNQGDIWFVREDSLEIEQISDWSAALNRNEDEQEDDSSGDGNEELIENASADDLVEDVDELDEDDQNEPPTAEDDDGRARRGQTVLIRVLQNDRDPDHDPLAVERLIDVDAEGLTASGASITIDPTGGAIQVVPPEDFIGEIRFGYEIHDGRGGRDQATVRVVVAPDNADGNQPPTVVDDNATVRAGRSVALNVLSNDSDPDGDRLTLKSAVGGGGELTFAPDGEMTYSPDVTSQDGTVEIEYTVADVYEAEAVGIARIRVRQADSNQPPQARNDVGRTSVGRPVILNVIANDVDPDGDPLLAQNLQPVDAPVTTAQLTPDGRFLFVPEAAGTYRFTYAVADGPEVDSAQIRVDVDAPEQNRSPIAIVDEVVLAVGETRLVRALDNDGDPDGDVVDIVDWLGTDGLEITPVAGIGFNVRATESAQRLSSFRYWISDGLAAPVRGDVIVSALDRDPVDYRPIARSDSVDVRSGQTAELFVLNNDYDPEGRELRIAGPIAEIDEGFLRISSDEQILLLTTSANQQFSFDFSYDVEDPAGNRAGAVVNVRIVGANQPNRAPVAGPDVARTVAGQDVSILVGQNDFDPDGDPITVESIAAQPRSGTVEIQDDGTIRYTPNDGFSGTDNFVYTLVDGYSPPADSLIPEDQRSPGRALGQVFVGVMPDHPQNRDPIAVDDLRLPSIEIGSAPLTLPVLANDDDPDGDELSVSGVTKPGVGEADLVAGGVGVLYSPPADGEAKQVAFSYTVSDGRGGSATAQVILDLVASLDPRPPTAGDDTTGPVRPGTTFTFDPRGNDVDPDGDDSMLELVPQSPLLRVTSEGFAITAPDITTELGYSVRDQQGLSSDTAFITVLVTPNEPPVVLPISIETPFNEPVAVAVHDSVSDSDDDPLVITLGRNRVGGSAKVADSADSLLSVLFTPDTDFEGVASFDFLVDDRNGHTIAGSVQINVLPPENRAPEAADGTVEVGAGTSTPVLLSEFVTDPDPDGQASHVFSISQRASSKVELALAGGVVTVSSTVNRGGQTESFAYTVVDGEFTDSGTITVEVTTPDFAPPRPGLDEERVLQAATAGPISVLDNDTDNSPAGLEGDGLVVTAVGVTPAGTTSLEGNAVVFVPKPSFFGVARFSYTIQDGRRSAEGESVGRVEVAVVGRPDKPQPPTIESVGNGYVVLKWNAPQSAESRAPVSGYILRYSASDGTSGRIKFDTPSTSYRWDGLRNAVEYCFSVAAVNEAGEGDFSESPGSAECGTPDVRPEAPSTPTVSFGNRELTVTWPKPLNQGSTIKNYQVRISGGRQGLSAELGVATTHTWTALANGTDYTFEVRAQNEAVENDGWSDWSPFSSREHPLTVPDAPAPPSAERGDRQVVVSWSAPANGGDTITLYQLKSSLSPNWIDVTPQGEANSHTWENIPNGTDVSFRVRAINRDPASTTPGNISPSSPLVRTCSVPDAPTVPMVARGDGAVQVSWQQPGDQGCAISEYRIKSSSGVTRTAPATATSFVFDGLTNGTSYTFNVAAINEVVTLDGRDPIFSGASAQVVPAGPPLVTNVTSATNVGVRQVRIVWAAASDNGSRITDYELSVNGGAYRSVGNVLSVTRTEATNGATYTYRVRAVNVVGPSVQVGAQKSVTTWDVPGAPNVSATALSASSVRGTWSAPNNGGTGFTQHEAKLTTGSTCASGGTVRNNAGSPEDWGSLAQQTRYRVCVRYRNAVGWGAWGARNVTTPAACSPFTIWGQSADTNLPGASIRTGPGTGFPRNGSIGPGQAVLANGWAEGNTPYTGNPSPYNEGVWYRLSDGRGYAIIAGVRGTSDTNDFDAANAPPRSPACKI